MPTLANRRLQIGYVGTVIAVGMVTILDSMRNLRADPPELQWFLLAALTLLTGSFTVKLPSLSAKISVSETFVFASVLLFGASAGTITVVLDALVISLWMRRDKRTPTRVLFNATAPSIAIRVASETFFWVSQTPPGSVTERSAYLLIPQLFAFALLYFVINTALVAGALGFERKESPWSIWRTHFPSISLSYLVGSSIALLIITYAATIPNGEATNPTISETAIVGLIVPLLVVSYLTFRTSLGRLEDANRHVSQLNDLYMSTVEALAMAVDAKDQVTHGHIRRVQVYAVELARQLGIEDAHQLDAVKSAALLHDMGKLAIPEHILNKPGRLTSSELLTMKRHADIGANLLSSIKFPYPVVPIVRHHHENWNGTGYPSGLAGADIPLGARILSVVDCFDALTSDRPYRPRLSNDRAFAILRERRGSMYDPLVVDTFIRVFDTIAPVAHRAAESIRNAVPHIDARRSIATLPLSPTSLSQKGALRAYAVALQCQQTTSEHVIATFACVTKLMPANVCVLFQYHAATDALTSIASAGDKHGALLGLQVKNGERVTGWAFANNTAIANSSAALDLASSADLFEPRLRSALVVPLKQNHCRFGVLSVYSTADEAFTDEHRDLMEQIGAVLSGHLAIQSVVSPQSGVLSFPHADSR